MTVDEAIKKAEENGFVRTLWDTQFYHGTFLKPAFWQALGDGLGNKDEMRCDSPNCSYTQCEYAGYKDPHKMFESFMETIWDGGSVESYFKTLK